MPKWISHEPVRWIGALSAALVLAVSLGLPLTPEQHDAIMKFGWAIAGLFLFSAEVARSKVTPVAKLPPTPEPLTTKWE